MSTVFKAAGELSVAAHRANAPEPRMVLEFRSYDAMRKFEDQMRQDTHELVDRLTMVRDDTLPKVMKYMGVEIVLSVRP
jgi:hypothetical protein